MEGTLQRVRYPRSAPVTRGSKHRSNVALSAAGALLVLLVLAGCVAPTAQQTTTPRHFTKPLMGAFVPSGFWHDLAAFRKLEEYVGGEFDVGHWYTSWSFDYDPIPVNDLLEHDRLPLVSWQSHDAEVADIALGVHDDYIRNWARQAAQAPGVLYVRPFPEMNGDWTPWHGDPGTLVLAWRHIVQVFREEGAYNVRWVFSPNVTDEPRIESNRMELYYPGHDYVDVLALDGYNWGTTRREIGWRTFEQVFAGGYDRITKIGPQPVWIAEVASAEHGGDKAEWIRDMLSTTVFDRLEAIIWFNEDKETDWRIESSHASADAFREWFEWRSARSPGSNPDDHFVASAPSSASSGK